MLEFVGLAAIVFLVGVFGWSVLKFFAKFAVYLIVVLIASCSVIYLVASGTPKSTQHQSSHR